MKKRSWLAVIRSIILLGVMSLLVGGTATVLTHAGNEKNAEEDSMLDADKTTFPVIPLIDAGVAVDFQTASFGLG